MDFSYDLYKVFYHAAKELNFSKAAANLFISQSAVSQGIKSLEDSLNCQLFIRHTKQVRLTKEGEMLFQHVHQALNFLARGQQSILDMQTLNEGEVWIGASDTICKYYLTPYLEKFHRLYPKIRIKITSRTSPVCIDLLKKGAIDLAVANIPDGQKEENIEVHKLVSFKDYFIGGKKFMALKNKVVKLRELKDHPIIMLEKNSTTRGFFDNLLKKHNVIAQPEIEVSSVELMLELTKIGLGISFMMDWVLEREKTKKEVFIINVEEEIPQRAFGVITNKNIPVSSAASRFIELLEEARADY